MHGLLKTTFFLLAPGLLCASGALAASDYSLRSPDQRIEVKVHASDRLRYDVLLKDRPLVEGSTLSITIDGKALGLDPKVKTTRQRSYDQVVQPVVRQKFASIREHYNELRIELEDGLTVVFRAFNEGAAYRLETALARDSVKVQAEECVFRFPSNYTVFYPLEESFMSHNERLYLPKPMAEIASKDLASLPAVVDVAGTKVAIAESDVEDYAGLWLRGTSGNALSAAFPPYPLKEKLDRDRDYKVTEAADYIAETRGTRSYPWRLLAIAERDGDLITNSLVYLLAKPSEITDTAWIKPGKVAWDWWNANNVYGVDFKAGVNTATYKYFIDFAAKYGIEYVVLDEGWYKLGNVLAVVPEINIEELMAYAKQKKVGIVLWVVWKSLEDQMIPALDQFARWGAQGIKVDFMQRDDQKLVHFYHQLSRECAKRHMLVDYHGAQKTAVMTRTWPNLISTEGVKGMENAKWSADITPEHNVTLPFTRMFLGPMDYTPGAMQNAAQRMFAPIFDRPMSMGTRCHQLAMYVVYESPLQMLSDSPSNYLKEPESMEFLARVPSVWDDTRVLDAKIADYIVVARRSGKDWYVGAMTDWTPRDLEIDLSFLPAGNFNLDAYADGVNADHAAIDYRKSTSSVTRAGKLKVHLAPGGGWAARLHP